MGDNAPPMAEIHPMAFINSAEGFQAAGDELYERWYVGERRRHGLTPLYFLYAHALELALKGFLRSKGMSTSELAKRKFGHNLQALLKECKDLELEWDADLRSDVANAVRLLDDSNKEMGLRYFTLSGQAFPELSWAKEVVEKVVVSAKRVGEQADPTQFKYERRAKLDFVVDRPEPK